MKRRSRIDKIWIGLAVAAIAAAVPPLGALVGFHSHPVGHHSHPAPVPRISLSKYADDWNVLVGQRTGYTVTAYNNSSMQGVVREFVDTLPQGFEYLKTSTSGNILADPIVEGRKLTWRGPFRIRGHSSFRFHFEVRAARHPGYYQNVLDARVRLPFLVTGTGPTAGILVGIPTELFARPAIIEDGTLRLKFSARLTSRGRPLGGQWIEFVTLGSPVSSIACGALTNANGVAECTGAPELASAVLALGYDARFDNYWGLYAPSYDHGDLVG